jgi:hypothetical protein
MRCAVAIVVALAGCGRGRTTADRAAAIDAATLVTAPAPPGDGAADWPELAAFARAHPRWQLRLDVDPVTPAFDVHGPIAVGDVAVVAGSAIGVVGVDVVRGQRRFHRPRTGRIAPPVAVGNDRILVVGDCARPVDVATEQALVGCYEVLDAATEAVHGAGTVIAARADAARIGVGPTRLAVADGVVWLARDAGAVRWTLGDPPRGEALAAAAPRRDRPASAPEPWASVGDGDARVDVWSVDDVLELRHHDPSVLSSRSAIASFATAPGSLHPVGEDEVRGFHLPPTVAAIQPAVVHARSVSWRAVGTPVPGIQLLAAAHGPGGFAVAVRLDASLGRDYVAAYAADGAVAWVYPLPPPAPPGRGLPVGLVWTDGAIVVFFDGAVVAGLPTP